KTLWAYRERLIRSGVMQELFDRFEQYLQRQGYQARKGQIVDASIVPVPRQRNTREENRQIKQGETPEEWLEDPAKLRQKDRDARWVVKHFERHYGYKNHVNVDVKHRFVRCFSVSPAHVHDSQHFEGLLQAGQRGEPVYGDGAYRSAERVQVLEASGFTDRLHYKGHKHQPLSARERRCNRARSRVRVQVEHVFAFQENSMRGKFLRSIGLARASFGIGMMNLVYNFMRFVQLQRRAA